MSRAPARPAIDDAAALNQLAVFLYGCRPHMLDAVTVDELCRRYRVSGKQAEYRLMIARQNRVGEPR